MEWYGNEKGRSLLSGFELRRGWRRTVVVQDGSGLLGSLLRFRRGVRVGTSVRT